MPSLKILLVEDSAPDIEFIRRELRSSGMRFSCVVADTREEFLAALHELRPDVILSDHSLPQFDSLEALTLAREFNPNVPFLLVTGTVSEEFAVRVIQQGADDYILKDHLMRLPSAIVNAIKKRTAEREREEMLEKLVRTNNELNMFLHKATHDLRGPLTSIMGLARHARREEGITPKSDNNLRMISESAEKLDDILLSLIQTIAVKNASLISDLIDPQKMVAGILESLRFMTGYDRIRFFVNIDCSGPFSSDEKMLQSILQNVIENAIKYQDADKPEPFIRIDIDDKDPGNLKIEVEDNGIGIPETIQHRVFELFYRGNVTSKGSGLGLYLVKYGVERLGGSVTLSSEEQKGTKISIVLPASVHKQPVHS